jgi:phytoene dehydrogenase-like protein
MTDAVVIGAGPNGLVAANLLADAGWSVLVLDAAAEPGGAVKSAEVTAPHFVNDLYSAFYPLAVASPVFTSLALQEWGLGWTHAPAVLAHPTDDGRVVRLHRDPHATAEALDAYAPGDGQAWLDLVRGFETIREPLLAAMFRPFPPMAPTASLVRRLGAGDALRFARFCLLTARRWTEEVFGGVGAASLVTGNALHTDLGPESAGGALFGWLLSMLGQTVGFPVPVGGAGMLTDALVRRLEAHGGHIVCGQRVTRIDVRRNRAVGVRTTAGDEHGAAKAVIAAVDAPQLLGTMLDAGTLPARLLTELHRFQWDHATVKVDWALTGQVPWSSADLAGAGTVHLGGPIDALSTYAGHLAQGTVPDRPYLVLGQMTTADATRSPAGTESAWAYTHVPQRVRADAGGAGLSGRWDAREVDTVVARMEAEVERHAPGFRDRILARHVMGPLELESQNPSLFRGALNAGSAAMHQQLMLRPVAGLGRPELPIRDLYLASASAHPGGGVHGGPGSIAAVTALRNAGLLGPARRAVVTAALRAIY